MISSNMFFCEECGAANVDSAARCHACQNAFDSSSTFTAAPVVIAPPSKPLQVVVPAIATPFVTSYSGNLLKQRYQVKSELGQGGFGVVYKAKDIRSNRTVAIKQINLEMLSTRQVIDATDSYNREVTILSRLQHKNLPRIYDHFTDATHWYLVMEYIEGETLEEHLKRYGPLTLKETLDIGIQLANVMHYLHSQKPPIIFRDVKPANIMRTSDGHLYLIDFGIARLFNPEKKRDTGPLGSPGYAAPEQYGKAQSTEQTDIYGLGATLNTLLRGDDDNENNQRENKDSAPVPKFPNKLQMLLNQMLEANISKRPKSMQEVALRLQDMQPHTFKAGLTIGRIQDFLWGLMLGSFPYPLLLIYALLSGIPLINQLFGGPILILLQLFFALWPLIAIIQFIGGATLLFTPRGRVIGISILGVMSVLLLAVFSGWIPWPPNTFASQFYPPQGFPPPHPFHYPYHQHRGGF